MSGKFDSGLFEGTSGHPQTGMDFDNPSSGGHNSLPPNQSQLSHIFRDEPGHLPDTPANRQRLVDVANDVDNYLGTDQHGNEWHARIEPDGSQTWTESRNGVIQEGGSNNPPRDWDDETGLNNNPMKRRK